MATPPGRSGAETEPFRPHIGWLSVISDDTRKSSGVRARKPKDVRRKGIARVLPTTAGAAPAVATRTPLIADLRPLLGQSRLHGGVAGALEANLDVIGRLLPLDLTPSVGQQVLQAGIGVLAQAVATRHFDVEALVDDLFVVRHRRHRVAGGQPAPSRNVFLWPQRSCIEADGHRV